jgi:hypothetical protein
MQSMSILTHKHSLALTEAELQGHAIKNKDLLVASGAISLKGADQFDELEADEQAVSCMFGRS